MDEVSKSDLLRKIDWALENKESISQEFLIKKTKDVVSLSIEVKEREFFIDENGIKWVRE
jgi:hypothetical protein